MTSRDGFHTARHAHFREVDHERHEGVVRLGKRIGQIAQRKSLPSVPLPTIMAVRRLWALHEASLWDPGIISDRKARAANRAAQASGHSSRVSARKMRQRGCALLTYRKGWEGVPAQTHGGRVHEHHGPAWITSDRRRRGYVPQRVWERRGWEPGEGKTGRAAA